MIFQVSSEFGFDYWLKKRCRVHAWHSVLFWDGSNKICYDFNLMDSFPEYCNYYYSVEFSATCADVPCASNASVYVLLTEFSGSIGLI